MYYDMPLMFDTWRTVAMIASLGRLQEPKKASVTENMKTFSKTKKYDKDNDVTEFEYAISSISSIFTVERVLNLGICGRGQRASTAT